jgi:ABC-2 type transport system ATP-binding protein
VTRNPRAARRALGYMPDFFGVYGDMKVWEYLDFFGLSYGLGARKRKALIGDLLDLVDLADRSGSYVDTLSRGMKQRLALARTLIHDPPVLLLDEPASGLDPRGRLEMRELLRELRAMGKTILISSHILSELADVCTHVGIMDRGRIVLSGTVAEVLRRLPRQRRVVLRTPEPERAREALAGVPGLRLLEEATDHEVVFEHPGDEADLGRLLARLVEGGLPVYGFGEKPPELEDVFLGATAEGLSSSEFGARSSEFPPGPTGTEARPAGAGIPTGEAGRAPDALAGSPQPGRAESPNSELRTPNSP